MKKHIFAWIILLIFLFLLPLAAVYLIPGDAGMAVCFLLFFAVDPGVALVLGILAGTSIRRLWYLVAITPAAFLAGFFLAVWEPVWDLIIYAAGYLIIGAAAMVITHILRKRR